MRALVTGVTGQDGSYLVEFLYREGMKCTGSYDERVPSTPAA